ncbi:DinB family protein [Ktedonospora formicarum]|uniref:DinB-like domain-containing protein n=1 Tax=Ktedonospora formicarum TaxID=2778364 RepID=A0A8J3HV13_9CHLR|nr:DinB family protein [Ktedonospora formicarum]GHO44279.1 hypothetical protein KSX_24420 [Ktedonospora formicarum]
MNTNVIDFYQQEQRRIHGELREAVEKLSFNEWHFLPSNNSKHIAFIFLHSVRTEDNVLRFILQGRPPIWDAEKWFTRLNLPERLQGNEATPTDARRITIKDPSLLLQYAERVWQHSEAYLASITDGGLAQAERIITVHPLGNIPALQVIGQVCISNMFKHLGEINMLLNAQGK